MPINKSIFLPDSFLGDGACGDSSTINVPPQLPQGAFRSQPGISSSPYLDGVMLQIPAPSIPNPSFTVVATGFRNPFRFALKPRTNELYVGNVGWDTWESIDEISTTSQNFGWPCYEGWDPATFGPARQGGYQATNYCESLNQPGIVTAPFFAYNHHSYVTTGDSKGKTCGGKPSGGGPDQNGSVISAIGFTDGDNNYPSPFNSALYFGDVARQCIWTIQPSASTPTPQTFAKNLQGGPVDLKAGKNGYLFYADFITSTVRRITHK